MIDCLYDKYKKWSESGSVYLFSDTHFDDETCKLMDPEWVSPQVQCDILRNLVHKCDTLVLLGDVGNPEYLGKIWKEGKRPYLVLIMGNHDVKKSLYEPYFDEIYSGPLFIADRILLSHEGIRGIDWCMNIHGHEHNGKMREDAYHLNLAANVCDYTPINLAKEIKKGLLKECSGIHRNAIKQAEADKIIRNTSKELYLMRHGETLFNKKKLIQGWCDSPLTELGIQQAKEAGELLKDVPFDHYYTSPSLRSEDTLIHAFHPSEYKRRKDLRERNFGIHEGESEDIGLPSSFELYDALIDTIEGESRESLKVRMYNCLDEMMCQFDHRKVLAVSHGNACYQFLKLVDEESAAQYDKLDNCAIMHFLYENHQFKLIEIIHG